MIINWAAMDTQLLRCYWQAHPQARAEVPDDLADHVLIFHRGVQVARMQGLYYDLKIDALLSFYILQPLWALLVLIAGWVRSSGVGEDCMRQSKRGCRGVMSGSPACKGHWLPRAGPCF